MIGELANHIWQSTLFALVPGLLTIAFRKNRAQVRYWLWFSASLKFFLPFALLLNLGSRLEWAPTAQKVATQVVLPGVSSAMVQISEPFVFESMSSAASTGHTIDGVQLALIIIWAVGFAAIAMMRWRAWRSIRTAVRTSTLLQTPQLETPTRLELRTSPGLLEPGVVGISRPILLLPSGIAERLTPPQLQAVLAHELCHVRRRDNFTSAIHMIVEAVFWFHPLVWWISARLVEERERACDEEVLQQGSKPQDYAEGILSVCKTYLESPLRCVSGVTGADLKKRIQAILTGHVAGELNFARKLTLTIAGMAVLAAPIAVGVIGAPIIRAQSQRTPKFETASIKPCAPGDGAGRFAPGERGAGGGFKTSPGRLFADCMTVFELINTYVHFGDDHLLNDYSTPMDSRRVKGGPAWVRSDRYTIDAQTNDPVANGPAQGPTPAQKLLIGAMLRSLLEDRFQLKTHRETEELPMYSLTIGKGGLKMQPMKEGGCIPHDPTKGLRTSEMFVPGQTPLCVQWTHTADADWEIDVAGQKMEILAGALSMVMGRHVFDKTGLPDLYSYHLRFAHDDATPGDAPPDILASWFAPTDVPAGPSVFTALEQLGLKLETVKGPREYLVIDSVQRPSPN